MRPDGKRLLICLLRARLAGLGALALGALLGCQRGQAVPAPNSAIESAGQPAATGPELFRDVTAASGIDFTYRNGEEADHYSILESLGGGVALLDYDGDGLLDVFLPGGGYFDGPEKKQIKGHPCRLYKNLGGFKFRDVTKEVGLDVPWFYSHGVAVADYDRDGWPDFVLTGYGRLALFHNEPDGKGRRRFVDVTRKAGLNDTSWSTSAAWADLDGDGWPDLYVCHYLDWSFANHPTCRAANTSGTRDVCAPPTFKALPHVLFRNNRNGTFTDVSRQASLRQQTAQDGMGLGVLIVDVNGDGLPDVYVANDTQDNLLYMNRSRDGVLRLEEKGRTAGVARDDNGAPNGSMGVDAADHDGSGRPSLFVTNYELENHAFYRNQGAEFFLYGSRLTGITALGRGYVGFGTAFVELDGDGWEDLVSTNGHVLRHPARNPRLQRPVLLRNLGGRFVDETSRGGPYFRTEHLGRGLAVGDLDNDGRPDLVITHVNEPVVVLAHQGPAAADGVHWLGVELRGRDHADVVGTRLILEAGGRRQTRFAKGGGSYLSSGDRRQLFGLGTASRVDRLTVVWPSGQRQEWRDLPVDRYLRLGEGEKTPQPALR